MSRAVILQNIRKLVRRLIGVLPPTIRNEGERGKVLKEELQAHKIKADNLERILDDAMFIDHFED